ncbi:MAG TPA: type IV pilus assembly protein PilM [Galbitalea sp.]|jgi:type IV pilus assembly protein PilM|nr:type IV pilus assembly protein PilM [Galbitalea sp.]
MAKNIVGVDISSGGIRAVEVRDAAGARPTVVKYDSIPLPEGAVLRGEVVEVATVVTALRQLWSSGGFGSKDVVLGIGNHRVLARDLSVPRMSIEHIRESLPFQVQDLLPVPVDQALLDFYPVSEGQSDQGPVVNGLLVAAVKESVDTNVRAVELAGLNPVDVDLIPFALCRVLLRGSNRRGLVAIIDVGSNTSTVVVARDGVPEFVRIISAGGRDLTDAIRSEGMLTSEQAEASKQALGLSTVGVPVAQQPIVEVIYKVAGELLNSLRNTLTYFVGSHDKQPISQIVLTGGGAKLRGFAQALQDGTQIPIVIADPFGLVSVDRRLAARTSSASSDAACVALGLALGSAA